MKHALTALLLTLLATTSFAQDAPRLSYPAGCTIGETCWILSFVDLDPGEDYVDRQCGYRTYAGHKGTDIALLDPADIAQDIPVYAVAPGRVLGARDGEKDNPMGVPVTFTPGKDCGNGVRIDHGNGWASQYCHLKRGSIAVRAGAKVAAGSLLGAIGNSGKSETPHLHMQLEKDGVIVDPFTGRAATNPATCGAEDPLWDALALQSFGTYSPSFIRHAGFADRPVEVLDAQAGPPAKTLSRKAGALVFYATIYGVPQGSRIELVIRGPDGEIFVENTIVAEERRARRFDFVGRRTPDQGWPAGTYTGTVNYGEGENRLTRTAAVILE